MEPSFFLSYWRPWNENSSFVDSWGDYLRDTSMVEYGANLVGDHIREASREQVAAIHQASEQQTEAMKRMSEAQIGAIRQAARNIGFELQSGFSFLNRRLDITIEQQRLSLMLQKNISDLLMIPDSEKERQQAITLGIQFFVNASKDPDLFDDALEEFLRAEQMKKQDYFVLHRIGCIYLFVKKHLNPQLAMDYFARAGKYAAVESNPDALRLVNLLTNSINGDYSSQTSDPKQIMLLAADSYEKAALASYIIGNNEKAVSFQEKALKYEESAHNSFTLAKYLIRSGDIDQAMKRLEWAIDEDPVMMGAVFCDADIAAVPQTVTLVNLKNSEMDNSLEEVLLDSFGNRSIVKPEDNFSVLRYNVIATLDDKASFIEKAEALKAYKSDTIAPTINKLLKERSSLIDKLNNLYKGGFIPLSSYQKDINLLQERARSLEWESSLEVVKKHINSIRLKPGDKVRGGIILSVNSTGKRGIMCADELIGPTTFFNGNYTYPRYFWDDVRSREEIVNCVDANEKPALLDGFQIAALDACKECRIGGYNNWRLPKEYEIGLNIINQQDFIKGVDFWTSDLFIRYLKPLGIQYYDSKAAKFVYYYLDIDNSFEWKNQASKFILPVREFKIG